jgi:hypothetical protein
MDGEAVDTRQCFPGASAGLEINGMTVLKKAISRAILEQSHDVETVKTIAVFCGVGMVVSLFPATRGLDMSVGFF